MSEAELHWLRNRLLGGKLTRAQRGRLPHASPAGLIYDAARQLVLDPNEEVQQAVRLLFSLFEQTRSALAVVKHFGLSTACSFRIAYGARIAMANCSGSRWGMAVPWMSCTTPAMQASTSMVAPRHASGRCPTSRRESRAGLVVWQRLIGPSCVTTRIRGTSAGNSSSAISNASTTTARAKGTTVAGPSGKGTPCCRSSSCAVSAASG